MNDQVEIIQISEDCRFIKSQDTTLLSTSNLPIEYLGNEHRFLNSYREFCLNIEPDYRNMQATWLFPEASIIVKERCDEQSLNFINQYFLEQSVLPIIAKHGFALPKIYIASRDLMLKEYIKGEPVKESQEMLLSIMELRNAILVHQLQNQNLFRDIMLDLFDECGELRTNNIIASSNGQIYLIDLFVNR